MATSRGQRSFVRAGWRVPWRRLLVALAAVPATVVGLGSLTPAYAQTPLFVAEGGTDGTNTCTNSADPCATITHALTQAAPGDTIEVSGTIVDRNIAPSAALNPITIAQDPNGSPAVINADGSGSGIIVGQGVDVRLDHLTIENGTAGGVVATGTGT
ncbi:MAG: hypothetical protein J2O38_03165, partial [Acidimicrobiales bacterium]|nr:hypothetical protein [Acidimicrobiales bacterium]